MPVCVHYHSAHALSTHRSAAWPPVPECQRLRAPAQVVFCCERGFTAARLPLNATCVREYIYARNPNYNSRFQMLTIVCRFSIFARTLFAARVVAPPSMRASCFGCGGMAFFFLQWRGCSSAVNAMQYNTMCASFSVRPPSPKMPAADGRSRAGGGQTRAGREARAA